MGISNPCWEWKVFKDGNVFIVQRWERDYDALVFTDHKTALHEAYRSNMLDYGKKWADHYKEIQK